MYKIYLKDEVLVKGYVPRQTPTIVQAINIKLKKLKKADFIQQSISLYSALIICVKKSGNTL